MGVLTTSALVLSSLLRFRPQSRPLNALSSVRSSGRYSDPLGLCS
jgi:hypothetical protein